MGLSFRIDLKDGEFLIDLSRKAVEAYLKTGKYIKVPKNTPKNLMQHHGVFVTISKIENNKKKLRGCIGYPYPTDPLAEAVIDSAINSAARDPRFYSLSLRELDEVVFEITVLTPPQLLEVSNRIEAVSRVKVGENGLIIEKGNFKGLLLPQVPVEWHWREEEFLCQCCIKAGLPPDSWLSKDTKIYTFNSIIFEETKPRGDVERKILGRK